MYERVHSSRKKPSNALQISCKLKSTWKMNRKKPQQMVEKCNRKHGITERFKSENEQSRNKEKKLKIEHEKGIELNGHTINNFSQQSERMCARTREGGKTANILKFLPFLHNYHLLNNNNPLIFIYYSLFNVQNVLFYPISHLSTIFLQRTQ